MPIERLAAPAPFEHPDQIAAGSATLLPDHSLAVCLARLPQPGVIILVHGVNSDGEWYDATEQGLCAGLNARMARQDEQLAYKGVAAGQLAPVKYTDELTNDGYVRPNRNDSTFIKPEENYSPVIRFRWGYKACKEEMKEYGGKVWLNENNYWGGGPFANGCSSIADLWAEGLNDRLFLWITAQHLNPVAGRDAYGCPQRAYYVHAALRLAKLIQSIRTLQADCPITVVCHSQGNMVGIGAAFLADKLGIQADNYILCNPPLSLVPDNKNGTESWTQRYTHDEAGRTGRVSHDARIETLKNYFNLLRARVDAESQIDVNAFDNCAGNKKPKDGSPPFTLAQDRQDHGLDGRTFGRVTLYCCPHDQVISALTVQGIGWRGLHADEIKATEGKGVFAQRVFAQGYEVGQEQGKSYHYLNDRWNKDKGAGKDGFWHPPSPAARFSLAQGLESNTSIFGKIMTLITAPVLLLVDALNMPVNADPPKDWAIPVTAPKLPKPFTPQSLRNGHKSDDFDEGFDPAGNSRDKTKTEHDANDPYDRHPTRTTKDQSATDEAQGDAQSEAQLRYEHRARLRMQARRAGMADDKGKVTGEDEPEQASEEYKRWRTEKVTAFLDECVNQLATDHSTIVTNPDHAEKAMAYDVAMGLCRLTDSQWRDLRVEADWRYAKALKKFGHPNAYLSEYFETGYMKLKFVHEWANDKADEASRPAGVIDERVWGATTPEKGHGR